MTPDEEQRFRRQRDGGENWHRPDYRTPPAPGAKVVAQYPYNNERGEPYGLVERVFPKGFRQKHWDGSDWQPGKPPGRKLPYMLPQLLRALPDTPVFICEGEKDAENVAKLGLLATCASEGAGKWTMDLAPWFMGRAKVFILQDNDEAGREHAALVARQLKPVVSDVRIVAFDELPEHGDVSDWLEAGGTKQGLLERAIAAPPFKDGITASALLLPDAADIPRREWLYWPHYIRGYVSLTLAPGGVGKSALQVTEAMAMASGKPLLGVQPPAPLKVWYLNLEDPMDELHRRFAAAAKHYGLTQQDYAARLFLNSGRTTPLVLATERNRAVVINHHIVRSMVGTIKANGIDVVVVDPFVASHRLQENDNAQIDALARTYAQIAEESQIAAMLVHHTRKMGPERGTVDDGRGASSLSAASRSARLLTVMTAKEAADADIPEQDRRSYFRADHGKANLTPPAERAAWFRMRSVDLGNESRDLDNGDSVGVVEAFSYPTLEQPRTSPADIERALQAVRDGGPWRENAQAAAWVGQAVARALGLGPVEGPTKRQVARLVKDWLAHGILVRVQGRDAKGRAHPYVEAGEIPSLEQVGDEA